MRSAITRSDLGLLACGVVSVLAGAAVLAQTAGQLSPQDREFIEQAARGGVAEVEEAQLARERAGSAEVKDAAAQIERDHAAANAQLQQLAAGSVALPTEPPEKRQAVLDRLKKMKGREFDREYVRSQVQAHEETIALFERARRETQNPQVRSFASRTLPKLKTHLQMMEGMQERL